MPKSPIPAKDDEFNTRELLLKLNKRLSSIAVAVGGGVIVLSLTIFVMMPLKKSIPFVVHVDNTTGEVSVPQQQVMSQFTPAWANESFFLRRWLSDLFTINQYLTVQQYDPRAREFIRGQNAITEYNDFRYEDQTFDRLAKDPTLVRDARITALTPIAGTKNGAVAEVTLTTRNAGQVTVVHKLVTLYFVVLTPTDPREIIRNPIGIYITDFKITTKD